MFTELRRWVGLLAIGIAVVSLGSDCAQRLAAQGPAAQEPTVQGPAAQGPAAQGEQIVQLNLSGSVKVTALLDLMSQELGIRFLHGTDIARREVTVYTPAALPKKVLPTLLGSLLREANLAIVDSEVPGWKRVVDIAEISSSAPAGDAQEVSRRNGPAAAVTQVLRVNYIDVASVSSLLKGFISKGGASIVAIPDQRILICNGYAADVALVAEILSLIDRPNAEGAIEFYQPLRRTPEALIQQYEGIDAQNSSGRASNVPKPRLLVDPAGQRVVVAGLVDQVADVVRLLQRLDSGMQYLTRVYRLQYVAASRIDNLIQGITGSDDQDDLQSPVNRSVETTIDEEGNLLVVRGGETIHRQIEKLIAELDRPVDSEASPIRFYKLRNATAVEVLTSLLALQQVSGNSVAQAGGLLPGAFGTLGGVGQVGNIGPNTMLPGGLGAGALGTGSAMNRSVGGINPLAGQNNPLLADASLGLVGENLANNMPSTRVANQNAALAGLYGNSFVAGGMAASSVAILPGGARISADVSTNSLIVYAPSNVQTMYERLIQSLDQRRPQVLVQADIIAIDTSDDFALGVEVSVGDRTGADRAFVFTSYGLSEVDPISGALTVNPAAGFNGVVVDPDVADVVVQAVSGHRRGKVLSSPKVLVNDNQTGILDSVASVPFQAFSQGQSSTLQGLGGNQEAGTKIEVTPHINEDDHLQLEFDIEFSTFVGTSRDNLPPPRQIDHVGSVVTIPDGKTIIVGGLKRTNDGKAYTGIPFLEKIPVVKHLTGLTAEEQQTMSFFVFLRPVILRDSQFRDLQFLSNLESADACHPGDAPLSGPVAILGAQGSGGSCPPRRLRSQATSYGSIPLEQWKSLTEQETLPSNSYHEVPRSMPVPIPVETIPVPPVGPAPGLLGP